MSSEIDQSLVIENLNRYLDWHNLPVRMNKTGICNGLATVYTKYALEGRLNEFRDILVKIATMTSTPEFDDKINHFAAEVSLSFLPSDYNKELNQLHSINMLSIEGKGLRSSYDFAMTTSDSNWTEILEGLKLGNDEAMIVRSLNHAVSISKRGGKYIIYDPNYSSGFKLFKNENELIQELHYNVFRYTGLLGVGTDRLGLSEMLSPVAVPLELYGPLSMQVQVIRHPDKVNKPRAFPDIGELLKKYLDVNQVALSCAGILGAASIHWAILMNDKPALSLAYDKGFITEDPVLAAAMAAVYNATEVLPVLLSKITDPKDKEQLSIIYERTLARGCKESEL
ncbi:hypothetical protein [uncultured Legionella sp.]|uniref:hypothetical protein n=1 Tax=uncultured Legionella sp. TaxID=210934 RepID=UPI00260B443A|nr:hypothetical protein [uncultured Legionella sp.]